MKAARFERMRKSLALALLLSTAAPAAAQPPQPVCGYGQICPGQQQVPFPVINPAQGLNNVLTYPLRSSQPQPPPVWTAPIATPPPVLPPGTSP
jgi:hypothetical protein